MIAAVTLAAAAALVAGDGLDCARGFEALNAQVLATPKIAPYASRDPLLATYNDGAPWRFWAVTRPGHPAHPAIAKRKINGMGPGMTVDVSACGYGDKAGFDQLLKDIDLLNAGVRKSYGG